jgi:hypothetical protein
MPVVAPKSHKRRVVYDEAVPKKVAAFVFTLVFFLFALSIRWGPDWYVDMLGFGTWVTEYSVTLRPDSALNAFRFTTAVFYVAWLFRIRWSGSGFLRAINAACTLLIFHGVCWFFLVEYELPPDLRSDPDVYYGRLPLWDAWLELIGVYHVEREAVLVRPLFVFCFGWAFGIQALVAAATVTVMGLYQTVYEMFYGRIVDLPNVEDDIESMATSHNVDPELLAKVIGTISGCKRNTDVAAMCKNASKTWLSSNRKTWTERQRTSQTATATTLAMAYVGTEEYQSKMWSASSVFSGMRFATNHAEGSLGGGLVLERS